MERSSNEVSNPVAGNFVFPSNATFGMGDRVRKKSGAAWQGQIVGWYCTNLTPEGYAVESEAHPGSVQIYPVAALERRSTCSQAWLFWRMREDFQPDTD
nr:dihydrofolate reductase [synthetic construct]